MSHLCHMKRHSDWYTRRNLAQSLFDAERSDDYAGGDSLWLTLDFESLRYDATDFWVQRTQPGIRGGDPTRSKSRGRGEACDEPLRADRADAGGGRRETFPAPS